MPAPVPTIDDLKRGFARYDSGERPWRQTLNRVDWFIPYGDRLYPLKYTYSLAVDLPPTTYNTDAMKHAMRGLNLAYFSLKSQSDEQNDFDHRVRESRKDRNARRERLRHAESQSKISYSIVASYVRNPDVVAEVLERADGICECCGNPAPFIRASDGTPYLEVHHMVFLANGGDDTVANAEALCPNCHRRKHFG